MSGNDGENPKFNWTVWLIWAVTLTLFFTLSVYESPEIVSNIYVGIVLAIIMGIGLAFLFYGGYFLLKKALLGLIEMQNDAREAEKEAEDLQIELGKDFFNNLVRINFKYIDKYYFQTQLQAKKSFYISIAAAVAGFLIVVAGVVQMYIGEANPAFVTTAAGVISEFIAAVFFYLYNRTILKMSDYHKKLVLTQNIGLAMRITQDMPEEQKLAAQALLVDRLSADANKLIAQDTPSKA